MCLEVGGDLGGGLLVRLGLLRMCCKMKEEDDEQSSFPLSFFFFFLSLREWRAFLT